MTDIGYYDDAHHATIACPTLLAQTKARMQHVAKYVLKGFTLDIGCGLGLLSNEVGPVYLGIDPSRVAIGYALENGHQSEHVNFSTENCWNVFEELFRRFDTIVISELLEHFSDETRSNAIYRAGKLLGYSRMLITLPVNMPQEPSHVKGVWSEDDVRELVNGLGKISELHKFGGPQNESWWLCAVDV